MQLGYGEITVVYPSGKRIKTRGTLHVTRLPKVKEPVPIIILEDNEETVLALDFRAIIHVDGVLRYPLTEDK